jgi:hypothetical protein
MSGPPAELIPLRGACASQGNHCFRLARLVPKECAEAAGGAAELRMEELLIRASGATRAAERRKAAAASKDIDVIYV